MYTPETKNKALIVCVTAVAVAVLQLAAGFAQLPAEVARFGYPETIFINGKIVTMDDVSASTNPGRIYQALAVKADKILKLGSNDEVRALAGPGTKILDLKGRTMLPGIVEPHDHTYGNVLRYADRFGIKFPPNGIVTQFVADRSLEKSQALLRETVQDAVKKVKPGDWIVVRANANPEAPMEFQLWTMTRRFTNRKTLDTWAPNNPVLMNPGLRGSINSKALERMEEFLPGYSASIQETMHGVDIGEDIPKIGWVGSQEMDVINWELFLQQVPLTTLAQALKFTSEELAAWGVSTFSTRIPFPKVMSGYATLAGLGQMPIRLDAHYEVHRMPTDPQQTRQMYRRTGVLQGIGDDYFWIDGVASERWDSLYPESCTGPDTKAPAHIKSREVCPKPGDLPWDVLQNALKAGWKLAGVHICGSESARAFLRMVEGARVANGWSMQEVQDMHMTGEHCNLIGKQPDVIEGLKKYGIILSCGPDIIKEAPDWVRDYGAQIEPFILPFRTWIESGVKLVGQHWGIRMINQPGTDNFKPPFFLIWQAVTRKYDGKVWQPDERIDRVHGLKMWTSWASEYVRKPEKLGTLAVGKFADLLVLDRDFFTVPEDDLLKIRPMMTMVGGKIVVLQEPLARDFGLQPLVHGNNYSFNFKDEDVAYIGKPQSEVVKQYKGKNSESSF